MAENETVTPLKAVMAEDGVSDLPYTIRGFFAKALIEERAGNIEAANKALDKAIALEAAQKAKGV